MLRRRDSVAAWGADMSLLYRIIYAAHANGTHHKLALDALQKLRHPQAEAWRNVMLKHVGLYLEGSKDPDNKFKDFKNHVLHVADNYWGGAPEKVENWYGHLVNALKESNWSEAAYSAGVLSHYYTDPIHPFHTGQTEAENNIHRAVEWSINRSYDALKQIGDQAHSTIDVPVPAGEAWLREMTCDGAEFSHRYYEKLIAHYDIHTGTVDPPAGLDAISRKLVAELIAYASTGFARILDRAFADCGQTPPDVSLALDTLIATLQIPMKTMQKRLANAEDRAIVQRMYDELKTTGTVSKTLPEDDRRIRELFAKEVLAPRAKADAEARAKRLEPQPKPRKKPRPADAPAQTAQPEPVVPVAPIAQPEPAAIPETNAARGPQRLSDALASVSKSAPRIYLASSDDLEAAPSIGPKTAQRFAGIGIRTVGEFLAQPPEDMSKRLDVRHMTPQILGEWQDQSRLVMSVPGLRGTHAQLLVGAGYRNADAMRAADAAKLCADVLAFVATEDGRRILRDGGAPDIEKIRSWIESAAQARAA
jgi:hypothetical protein